MGNLKLEMSFETFNKTTPLADGKLSYNFSAGPCILP